MSKKLDGASADDAPDSAVYIAPPSPKSGYAFTLDDARRGRAAQAARQRKERDEARKSVAVRLAEKIEAEADRILSAYFAAIDSGDWRAGEALLDRHLGKAVQRQEIEDVTERSADVQADLAELERLDRELKARKAA